MLSCAVTSLVLGCLVVVSTHIVDQTRAQIAADASALGGIYGGESMARDIALRNGAQLASISIGDNMVQSVKVHIGSQYATAFARDSWAQQLPTMSP
jgi:hypothetical protein